MLELAVYFSTSFLIGWSFSTVLYSKPVYQKFDFLGRHKGLHFHHSVYGLMSFAVLPFENDNLSRVILLVGFGLGVIIHHTIKEGFVFVTRD